MTRMKINPKATLISDIDANSAEETYYTMNYARKSPDRVNNDNSQK